MTDSVLVTGAAGFIGSHVARQLVDRPATRIVGVDNFDDYYDPQLKRDRLQNLRPAEGFSFEQLDVTDHAAVDDLFDRHEIDRVIHLAAQPGVRASSAYPQSAVESNIGGFLAILEACRHHDVEHLVFASSSSVYGRDDVEPLTEDRPVKHPVSLYAATKVSNEAMAHSYAHLYDIPTTGLRFFTVYGPWGRPDMAYYLFADAIARDEPIEVFNDGQMRRDFTYVDDVVEGISRLVDQPPSGPETPPSAAAPDGSPAPYRILNVGRNEPVELMRFISIIEEAMGRQADKRFRPMPNGDVESTHADTTRLSEAVDFTPEIDLEEGLRRFVDWYRSYHDLTARSFHRSAAE
jgi:UDP-glucuronate 4-epimerase